MVSVVAGFSSSVGVRASVGVVGVGVSVVGVGVGVVMVSTLRIIPIKIIFSINVIIL